MYKVETENCLLELAQLIPVRNINFYFDVYSAMSAIDLNEMWISGGIGPELERLESLISGEISPEAILRSMIEHLTCVDRLHSFCDQEILGHVMLRHILRKEENSGERDGASKLPFIFTAYSIVQDLIFHGHGPNYYFVGEALQSHAKRIYTEQVAVDCWSFLTTQTTQTPRTAQTPKFLAGEVLPSLAKGIVTATDCSGSAAKKICARYTHEDIAAIFLAYSFVVNRTVRPLVPFPRSPAGFPAFLLFETKMLFPRIFQVVDLSM